MFSRREASQLRQEFWTSFGQYMTPLLSAEGEKINWINYKTGEKQIYFRMQADNKTASIGIELMHADEGIREIYFEEFLSTKMLLEELMQEEWIWMKEAFDLHGKAYSRIYIAVSELSVFRKQDWPGLISFFKPRLIALDEYWSLVKYRFESLR